MDGLPICANNLSWILFNVDERLPNLQTLVIKNNQDHIWLKEALQAEGEDKDEGDDHILCNEGNQLEIN